VLRSEPIKAALVCFLLLFIYVEKCPRSHDVSKEQRLQGRIQDLRMGTLMNLSYNHVTAENRAPLGTLGFNGIL